MPSSNYNLIPSICQKIHKMQPKSILDIAIGFGKYGYLAREYTDISYERYKKEDWKVIIDGIEIFPDYITDLHRIIYNNIHIGNAVDIMPNLGNYDLIIFIDAIEHMTKEDGRKMLNFIKQKSKCGLIATPVNVAPQLPSYGNENERHISSWSEKELLKFGTVTTIKTKRGIFLLEISGKS